MWEERTGDLCIMGSAEMVALKSLLSLSNETQALRKAAYGSETKIIGVSKG